MPSLLKTRRQPSSSAKSGAGAIRAIQHELERGQTIVLFPEGATFAGDELRPFPGGAFIAATRGGTGSIQVLCVTLNTAQHHSDKQFRVHRKLASRLFVHARWDPFISRKLVMGAPHSSARSRPGPAARV